MNSNVETCSIYLHASADGRGEYRNCFAPVGVRKRCQSMIQICSGSCHQSRFASPRDARGTVDFKQFCLQILQSFRGFTASTQLYHASWILLTSNGCPDSSLSCQEMSRNFFPTFIFSSSISSFHLHPRSSAGLSVDVHGSRRTRAISSPLDASSIRTNLKTFGTKMCTSYSYV